MRNITRYIWSSIILLPLAPLGLRAESFPGIVHLNISIHHVYSDPSGDLSKNRIDTIVFNFYDTIGASKPKRTLSFYSDWSRIPRKERILQKDFQTWFTPISFDINDTVAGYFEIYLTCKRQNGDWLEVILNDSTGEAAWVKKTQYVKLIEWGSLDKRKYWVTVQNNSSQYFSRPDTGSTQLKYSGVNCFELIRVRNDWMLVSNKNNEMCNNYNQPFLDKVWIKFKTQDRLLIDLNVR